MRVRVIAAAALAATCLLVASAPAQAAVKPRPLVTNCSKLKGPFVLRTTSIKVVKVRRGADTLYRACSPGGFDPVLTAYRAKPGERVRFLQHNGGTVTFEVTSGSVARRQTTDYVYTTGYFDPVAYWQDDAGVDCANDFRATQPPPVRTLLVDGALVVVYSSGANVPDSLRGCYPNPGETLLVSFARFEPQLLDLAPAADLPASSVRSESVRSVAWTVAGVKRSAAL